MPGEINTNIGCDDIKVHGVFGIVYFVLKPRKSILWPFEEPLSSLFEVKEVFHYFLTGNKSKLKK